MEIGNQIKALRLARGVTQETLAEKLGLAFQIRDDVLDALGDPEKLGKNTGMDSAHQKRNYVTLLGADAAQELVEKYTQEALDALGAFPRSTEFLRELTLSLVRRES